MPRVVEHQLLTKNGEIIPFKARIFDREEMKKRIADRRKARMLPKKSDARSESKSEGK